MAPGNPEKVFWGPDSGNLILFPLVFFRNSPTPTLLVHDACWQVLLDRVQYGTTPSKDTAYVIAQAFYPIIQRMEAWKPLAMLDFTTGTHSRSKAGVVVSNLQGLKTSRTFFVISLRVWWEVPALLIDPQYLPRDPINTITTHFPNYPLFRP